MATVVICDFCDDRITVATYYLIGDNDACRNCYELLKRQKAKALQPAPTEQP